MGKNNNRMNKTVTRNFTNGHTDFEGRLKKRTSSNHENGTSIVNFSDESENFGTHRSLISLSTPNRKSGSSPSGNRGKMGKQEMIGFCIGTIFGGIVLIAVFYYLCKEYCWKRYFRKLTIKKEKLYELEANSEETETLSKSTGLPLTALKTRATTEDETLSKPLHNHMEDEQKILIADT